MFTFTKKKKETPSADAVLDKKSRKEGRLLVRGVRKFLRYNDDLIDEAGKSVISEKLDVFCAALGNAAQNRKDAEEMAHDLTETCRKSVKDYQSSAMKENLEILFVAVVIAMGIRAYFFQQFKIPTGSMQPTLNGIIAYPDRKLNPDAEYTAPEGYQRPGLPTRLWDKFWYGRSHVDWVSKENDVLLFDRSHFYDKNLFIFFPRTYLITEKGRHYSAPGSVSRVASLMNFTLGNFPHYAGMRDLTRLRTKGAVRVNQGEEIAKGFVDTGDQLVVDKFSYHWRKPRRGEVFVFHTNGIPYIQATLDDPRQGSLHYIKRLVGKPGDHLEVVPPFLKVNGAVATEFGIKRVMSQEGHYTGYTDLGTRLKVTLGDKEYWAMGDNSANSSDSRTWGVVPQGNIVGRAQWVYYPFGHHFGTVK